MTTLWSCLWQALFDGYAMRCWLACKRGQVDG